MAMETRNRKILFKGLVVNMEQMEVKVGEKGWHLYQIIRHPGGVGVLPLHEDGTVTLIRQLRPAMESPLLEIPAGRLNPGESPAACGLRELAEEAGLVAGSLGSLGIYYPSPGILDEVNHLFLATDLAPRDSDPELYEEIETVRLPFSEARRMARIGAICDGKTLASLFRAGERGKKSMPRRNHYASRHSSTRNVE